MDEKKPKLVIATNEQNRTGVLALWCRLRGALMVCPTEKEAARVQVQYGIRAVASAEYGQVLGTHRGNVAIDNLWLHERPRAVLSEALIVTSGLNAEVVCSADDWFDVVSLEEFHRSLRLGDDHPEAER